jgi:hypothetical protein
MNGERTQGSQVVADGSGRGRKGRRHVLPFVALVGTVAAAVCAVVLRTHDERSLFVQVACLVAALMWVVSLASEAAHGRQARRLHPAAWLPGLVIIVLACLLHARMLSFLPLPERTGFEELQMGADGYKILTTSVLPLEFRFSKAIAALGVASGGATVEALRLPFQIMGFATLAVLYLCLRALGVGRWPSAFVTITAAVSRWFVIGSGVAYEDFSAMLILFLLLFCLLRTDPERASAAAWAAGAGVLAGMLLFENSSFRFVPILGGAWLLWVAVAGQHHGAGRWYTRWRPLAFFLITMALVSAPMLVDAGWQGRKSIFFEAVTRYAKERPTVLAPAARHNLARNLEVVVGRPVQKGSLLAPVEGRVVQPVIGSLFVLAALAGLVRPRRPFVRAVTLAAFLATVVCSVTTNDVQITRLAPVVSIMLLPLGAFLEDIGSGIGRALSHLGPAARWLGDPTSPMARRARAVRGAAAALVYSAASLFIVEVSAARIDRMAGDRGIWREYSNDQYVAALYLAKKAKPEARVLVVTPGLERVWSRDSIAYWVYADKHLKVTGTQRMPPSGNIEKGTMVVLAPEGRPLSPEETDAFSALAEETGSLATLDFFHGRADRILVASMCVGCGGGDSAASSR